MFMSYIDIQFVTSPMSLKTGIHFIYMTVNSNVFYENCVDPDQKAYLSGSSQISKEELYQSSAEDG